MPRPTVLVALPPDESEVVCAVLEAAGFHTAPVSGPTDVLALIASGVTLGAAIVDAETDLSMAVAIDDELHAGGRAVPTLVLAAEGQLDSLSHIAGAAGSEFVIRPYSADSLRWRIEALVIRAQVADIAADTSDAVFFGGGVQVDWTSSAPIVVVFSPKGGVGKTTVATNVAAAVQVRLDKQVLLVDADTVTGHVMTSLALEGVRTVNDAWRDAADGGDAESFLEIATNHASGMKVLAMTLSPLQVEMLEPERVVDALNVARHSVDLIVVDLHPSYHPLNLALFAAADQILVPVTPDIPAVRAAVQYTDVAAELNVRDRLELIVNRADSGLPIGDIERTVGLDSLARIRSGGMLFVRAANVGRTVIDLFPREKITDDFVRLAERVLKGDRVNAGAAERAAAAPGGRVALPILSGLFAKRSAERPEPRPATPS